MADIPEIRVAAGIVENDAGEFLLSSRPEGKPYAGYWEFAGGKIEAGETPLQALKREFAEELGIEILHARPWLAKTHRYEHALVHLYFFRIAPDGWCGQPEAREGQRWAWQQAGRYTVEPMLPANQALLAALAIPPQLFGSLKTGFSGCHGGQEYRVVPYRLSSDAHANIVLDYAELQTLGRLPAGKSVWVGVSSLAEFQAAQDADVLLWRVDNDKDAAALNTCLQNGTSLPLLAYADNSLWQRHGAAWLEQGLHGWVRQEENEVV